MARIHELQAELGAESGVASVPASPAGMPGLLDAY